MPSSESARAGRATYALEMHCALAASIGSLLRAGIVAGRAADALLVVEHEDRFPIEGLGVLAPPAAQRAAEEEDDRADSRPVVNAETLHIGDVDGGFRFLEIRGHGEAVSKGNPC